MNLSKDQNCASCQNKPCDESSFPYCLFCMCTRGRPTYWCGLQVENRAPTWLCPQHRSGNCGGSFIMVWLCVVRFNTSQTLAKSQVGAQFSHCKSWHTDAVLFLHQIYIRVYCRRWWWLWWWKRAAAAARQLSACLLPGLCNANKMCI